MRLAVYFATDDRYAPYAFAAARRVKALSTRHLDVVVFVDGESRCSDPAISVRHFRVADIVPARAAVTVAQPDAPSRARNSAA